VKSNSIYALIIIVALLNGCSSLASLRSAPDFSIISVGMGKDEVREQLGKPTHVAAQGNKELFVYEWDNRWDGAPAGMFSYVGFENGKVIGYYADFQRRSTSFNIANAWTQIQSADRTNINMKQINVNE